MGAEDFPAWQSAGNSEEDFFPWWPREWEKMYPEGRTVYYSGKHPGLFRAYVMAEFGFDPAGFPGYPDDPSCHKGWNEKDGWYFHCPAKYLDVIYGANRYPVWND